MSWKIILGGVGLGVGAVALAPFTGGGSIAGAIALGEALTVGGAVAGVVGGGVAGAMASKNAEKEGHEEGHEKGYQQGKAENNVEIAKLKKKFQNYNSNIKSTKNYFEQLIAMESIAVACLEYFKVNTKNKQEEISDLLHSIGADTLPQEIKNKINNIYNNPPTIQEALTLAKNTNLDREICKNIIILTADIYNINSRRLLIEWEENYV